MSENRPSSFSFKMIDAIRQPLMTKNTSTPTNPPENPMNPAWQNTTGITATARSEFQAKNRDGVRSYGSSAKHFDADRITDLQDMARCFGNMADYYLARGSPVSRKHFSAVQKFALSLTTDECGEPDVVTAAVKWLDGINLKFMLGFNTKLFLYGFQLSFTIR